MEKDCSSSTKEQQDIVNSPKKTYTLNKNRTKGGFLETLKKNIEENKGFYDSCGTE